MGSLNIAEWSPDQVMDWLSGLGPTVAGYVPALRQRGLDGAKLLTLRCDDLEYLGIHIIGHQELLLEAVEHLRNFTLSSVAVRVLWLCAGVPVLQQYEVSRECVQQLALRVSGAATYTRIPHIIKETNETIKDYGSLEELYNLRRWAGTGVALGERKAALLKLALEAATCAQRDRFAEQPARAVAAAAAAAAQLADYIIQVPHAAAEPQPQPHAAAAAARTSGRPTHRHR
ncbi:Connector enhancer of kinase suppressor of ras 3 [Papilio machaon]|uniref:Connector enhancer of kinase suppressor of ras 3 n=1 Tax=Papilio machaon TaxID=76193 RepID=A0A0N1PG50_PAPMA|nr:Connector enhancer of kinase suppressor of ras 3 [Papilio machaon]